MNHPNNRREVLHDGSFHQPIPASVGDSRK